MPFSFSSQLSAIVGYAESLNPGSVLDVGIGMGQYGFLLRNNLEALNLFEIQGDCGWQRDRSQWRVKIDGIEAFEKYLTPVHRYAYTNIIIDDALSALPRIEDRKYEMVLAIDILEHFEKAQGLNFLQHCKRVCSKSLLVSTPKEFIEQQVPANPFEDHRSHWTPQDLIDAGATLFLQDTNSIIAVFER